MRRRLPHITTLPGGGYRCVTPDGFTAEAETAASAFDSAIWLQQASSRRRQTEKSVRGPLHKLPTVTIESELLKWILTEPKENPGDGVLRFGSGSRPLRDRIMHFYND
jgi:hypothetical protein